MFFFLSISSCTLENPNFVAEDIDEKQSFTWICHNPESDYHNKECNENTESFCLENGNSSKFCWILDKSECSNEEFKEIYDFCQNLN
jgi:putative sterol carrier protein